MDIDIEAVLERAISRAMGTLELAEQQEIRKAHAQARSSLLTIVRLIDTAEDRADALDRLQAMEDMVRLASEKGYPFVCG